MEAYLKEYDKTDGAFWNGKPIQAQTFSLMDTPNHTKPADRSCYS